MENQIAGPAGGIAVIATAFHWKHPDLNPTYSAAVPLIKCTVQVKLELGHRAQLRKKVTTEGFTHDWMVFVRGPETADIQHFVEKVVFRLHESFPKPKRVCKEPPYKVEESGYAGFLMPIEVYFKNKEEPKKVCFNYDLFLNLEGNPPVNHLRCEKLTFNNPTREFRHKLLKAGGVMVVPEGTETVSRPSPDYPMLPTIPLSAFSDPKKTKPSHGSKESSKESSGVTNKSAKPHKLAKEHRERPRKDSESKALSKGESDRDRDGGSSSSKPLRDSSSASSSSSSSKKPVEVKVKEENKPLPKAAFKEPKLTLKEAKMEGTSPKGGGAGGGGGGGGGNVPEARGPCKRSSAAESPKPSVKKQKKGGSEGAKVTPGGGFSSTSPRISSSLSSAAPLPYPEKKPPKEKGRWTKVKVEAPEVKEIKKPPESEESNSEDEASSKSESAASSPSNSSSSSDSSSESDFEPSQKQGQGPLRSMVEDLQSEESDDDDSSSEDGTPVKTNPPNRDSRLSLDSESDSSDGSHRPGRDPPPPLSKHSSSNNKTSGRKSPEQCSRPEKILKKAYNKAYTEELVDLHRRLMALRERNVLQQIVNLIEETGHFNVTNTTFDFDLFSLDESTVRKLQSYLEATAT
ncbi:protein ENL isoform X3 [Scleropages formosus]|uniref:protein ENL isoform X3 n=1 Tax=Scleropages formosus TaxID=113540 RepID=UPI000877F1E7|nr:protein ENL isoform X3 [Scleropages formosus]